jgi:TolB-like protein
VADARIAVLPFVATNPQSGNSWMGKSIQQSLDADLLRMAPSRVQTADATASTSADAAAAGRQLGVNYVIFGTFTATDQAVRIVGQVVDVSSGTATSGLKVTGKLGDVFILEDDLSHQARTAIFGQSAADNEPPYTVHELPDSSSGSSAQTYTPPNGATTYVNSSTGYAYPAQTPDYSQVYTNSSGGAAYYSYPSYSYYSYPYYTYGYPYYGYPGVYLGFGFYGGGHYHYGYGGGYHGGGYGGGYHGGGGFGGGGHGGGGHR